MKDNMNSMNNRKIIAVLMIFLVSNSVNQGFFNLNSRNLQEATDLQNQPSPATAPNIEIIDPLNNIEIQSQSDISFIVETIDGTVDTVWYNWDEAADIVINGGSPYTITCPELEDGFHTLIIHANNSNGETRTFEKQWIIDDTKPQILFLKDLETKNGNIFEFVVVENNSINSVYYHWDSTSDLPLSGPLYSLIVPDLSEGHHTFNIIATDNASNSNSIQSYDVIIDETAPIITRYSGLTIQNTEIINLDISDTNTLDHCYYNWNDGSNNSLEYPFNITASGLSEGSNELNLFAYDIAGNLQTELFSFSVDDAPSIVLHTPTNNSEIKSSQILNFDVTDLQSIESVFFNWDDGANITLNVPYNITIGIILDGLHKLNIYANDTAGKLRHNCYFFTIDDTKPTIQLMNLEMAMELQVGAVFNLNISELNSIHTILYTWDGYPEFSNSLISPYEIKVPSLSDGENILIVNAQDKAGNLETQSFEFIIDNQNPAITLLSPKEGRGISPGDIIDLQITDENTVNQVNYNWNGGSNSTLNSPYNIIFVDQGTNEIILNVYAEDLAGNRISTAYNFSIDDTIPTIQMIMPQTPYIYQSGTLIELTISDPLLEAVWYHWDDENVIYGWSSPYVTNLPLEDGVHRLYVSANDTLGNTAHQIFEFIADNSAPNITLTNPTLGGALGQGDYATFFVQDQNDLVQVLYNWNNGTNITINAPYAILVDNITEGSNNLLVFAQDQANNWANVTFEIFIDTTAPLISLMTIQNNAILQPFTIIAVSIIEPYLQNVSYAWDNSTEIPWQGNYQTLTPMEEGLHVLHVYAWDQTGNEAYKSFNITSDNTPPTISLTSSKTRLTKNSSIILSIIDNFALAAVHYNWDNGENVTLNGTYQVFLPVKSGSHTLQVYAQDEAGNWVVSEYSFTTKVSVVVWISLGVSVAGGIGGGTFFLLKKKKKDVVDQEKLQDWFKDHGYKLSD
ncbi:hypothetical protein [Candidatus Lokiarchaeum ossiferum]